jgi:hypothetical protein
MFENQPPDAIRRLLDLANDFGTRAQRNEVIEINMSFRRLEAAERRGVLGYTSVEKQLRKLLRQVLELVDLLELQPDLGAE